MQDGNNAESSSACDLYNFQAALSSYLPPQNLKHATKSVCLGRFYLVVPTA